MATIIVKLATRHEGSSQRVDRQIGPKPFEEAEWLSHGGFEKSQDTRQRARIIAAKGEQP